MAATPENKVKAKVKELLDKYAPVLWYFMPAQNGYGRAGIPDFVGCYRGRFFSVECKAGKGTTTALQEREMNAIHTAGGMSIVVREDTLDLLHHWLQQQE